MQKIYLAAALSVFTTTPVVANGFDPDPQDKYEVLSGIGTQPIAQQKATFDDILSGGDTCAPQVYLDQKEAGFIHVSLLANCHTLTDVTLLHHGKSQAVTLSQSGAALTKVQSASGTGRVTAAFGDGTVIAREIDGPNRTSAELIKN